nr:SHOCT domain-containing protein [Natrinema sp. CBA1119]
MDGALNCRAALPRLLASQQRFWGDDSRPLSVFRERYARGELSDEEFERRRKQLE